MAQTTGADAHRGGAGQELGKRHLHRVVRREASVGQRRGSHGIQAVRNRHQKARVGDEHVLGLASVDAESATERRSVSIERVVAVGVLTAIAR